VLCSQTADPLAIVDGVPWPLVKWAEEGYAVVGIEPEPLTDAAAALKDALAALRDCADCTSVTKVGIVGT
jgi:carboxymethylenebutenolidase